MRGKGEEAAVGMTPGSRLGPYEIGAMLGAGGMGEVYRARDTRLDRTVAIKVLPAAFSVDPGRRERFDREARSIAALTHPNICVLHDVGHQDGVDYLVMEHVTGESLSERLKKGPLPLAQVLQIGSQIADALDRAHRAGIVHRDLKPGNVLLTGSGTATQAKLLDFGLAKLTAPATAAVGSMVTQSPPAGGELTGDGAIVGTTRYMAPEQLEGGTVDGRTDIFALGAVLYEMTTGQKAFEGKSNVSVIAAILEHQPTPISKIQPLTPPAFEHLVTTCLAKSPDERWQTARDVAKQLQWIASTLRPAASVAITARSRRAPVRAVLALVIVIAAVLGVWAVANRFRSQPPRQVLRFEVSTPVISNPGVLTMLAASPDGRTIAFIAQEAGGAPPTLWLRNVDAVQARKVIGTEGALQPFWSPDSRHVAFTAQGRLMRVDTAGGPPQAIATLPSNLPGVGGGTWRDDGTIVFGGAIPLMKVSASGGEPVPVTTVDTGAGEVGHAWPVFLPDGRHLLFLSLQSGGAPRHIKVVNIDNPKEMADVLAANSNPLYSESGHLLFHRDGTLMAQAFDVKTLSLTGDPVRIADGLA
jgi:eukaryotic-like serine/threonine-protein kinase